MSRFTPDMTPSQKARALSLAKWGKGFKPHTGTVKALRKISGALLPLKKDRKFVVHMLDSADAFELYGDKISRLFGALGGNAQAAATVILAAGYGKITQYDLDNVIRGNPIDIQVLVNKLEDPIPGYRAQVFEGREPSRRTRSSQKFSPQKLKPD